MKKTIYCILIAVILSSCFCSDGHSQCAKFAPPSGKALLILGQDMGAVGGFQAPDNNGYSEHVGAPVPGGITTYLSIPSLAGMTSVTNYGAGDICAQCITDNPAYANSTLVIGLYLVNELDKINAGTYDNVIQQLDAWFKARQRPVFLRIGYEYDGPWNNYNPTAYISAYQRIVNIFRQDGVSNCAFVWQGSGTSTDSTYLKQWYPGDNYVDWCAYSHFKFAAAGYGEMALARSHHKPLMIAESTPKGDVINQSYSWNTWFGPLFQHIQLNKDVIKALAYINVNWDSQSLWKGQGWGDSRIENSDTIKKRWLAEINSPFWLNASPTLFKTLSCPVLSVVEEDRQKPGFSIFPNPARDALKIALEHSEDVSEIILSNLNGQVFYKELSSNNPTIVINLDDRYSQGLYLLTIIQKGSCARSKIMVYK